MRILDWLTTVLPPIVIACIFYGLLRDYFGVGRIFGTAKTDEPIISAADMLADYGLQQLDKGHMAGYPYLLLTNKSNRVMLHITLPEVSELHLVAVGAKSRQSSPIARLIRGHFLEPVGLEGDFPKDFYLYCTPGHQTEIRQVFEPVTMAYVMEFCRSYRIELFQDTFYIAQADQTEDQRDTTTMVEDAKHLLERHGDLLARLSRMG